MAALKYWLWLTSKKEISNTTALKLVEYFKSPENVFFSFGEGCTELCLKENEKAALLDKSMFKASAIMEQCDNLGVGIITVSDSAYPERLKNIYDPPAVLYVKGKLTQIDDEAVIAMVGTRKASAYGLAASERIAFETVKCGGIVATGLAEGIDTAAAKGALKGGGKVLGVLGNGIDVVYPYFNKQLYRDVVSSGALISEFAPGTRPLAGNFPRRNRIISGLSVGVAVVESPKHGGSLITAARALEQGRDLFAVPGNIDSENSGGTNDLIREGAIPVTCGFDIIQEYIFKFPDKLGRSNAVLEQENYSNAVIKNGQQKEKLIDNGKDENYISLEDIISELDEDEGAVITALDNSGMCVDDIIQRSKLPVERVLAALTMLEIKGYAAEVSGRRFILNIDKK